MADEKKEDKFDIDKLLDKAGEEDELATELEKLKTQATDLLAQNAELQKKLEGDGDEDKEKDKDKDKDEESELSPEMQALNKKLEDLETGVALDREARIAAGMSELKTKYPDLMTNKDILDAPLLDGAATSAKEFLESMIAGGDLAAVDKAVSKIALLNGLKLESPSSALPRGRGTGGEAEPDAKLKAKITNVNEMIAKMRTGEFSRQRAKDKGLI